MPDDKSILTVIGRILQRYASESKKKERREKLERGLESKLRNPQSSLSSREQSLLSNKLAAASLEAEIGGTQTVGGPFSLLKPR